MFFNFPAIKKYIFIDFKAQFVFPGRKAWDGGSVCRDFTRRAYSWDQPLQGKMNKERKLLYLAEEILCEAVSTRIQKILKGFRSWVSLAELWCTGARWLALLIALSASHCMQAASGRKKAWACVRWVYLAGGTYPLGHRVDVAQWQWQVVSGISSLGSTSSEGNQLVQCQDTFLVTYIDWLMSQVEKPLIGEL